MDKNIHKSIQIQKTMLWYGLLCYGMDSEDNAANDMANSIESAFVWSVGM